MADTLEHRNTQLESVLGASPRGFESPILRHENGPVTCEYAGDGPFVVLPAYRAETSRLQLRLQLQKAWVVTTAADVRRRRPVETSSAAAVTCAEPGGGSRVARQPPAPSLDPPDLDGTAASRDGRTAAVPQFLRVTMEREDSLAWGSDAVDTAEPGPRRGTQRRE